VSAGVRLPDTVKTILDALAFWAERTPDAPALIVQGRPPVTYAALWRSAHALATDLQGRGIARDGRIVLLLPDGATLAAALLGTMSAAVAVPLEAMIPVAELASTLRTLRPAAALMLAGDVSASRDCCRECGVPVVDLHVDETALPAIERSRRPTSDVAWPRPNDVAVLRRTSGTTGTPKWIARTQESVIGVGRRYRSAIALHPGDRAPSVSPLSQTLAQGVLLHCILSGSALICPPHADIARLWASVEVERPTWMAVPAGFLELLVRLLRERPESAAVPSLRFVQVTSAAIAPETCDELARRLGAPVLPRYSSTEAGTVALTLPPPAPSKRGSVGRPVLELAIVDAAGDRVGAGVPGEIWIRGRHVLAEYLDDPVATASALTPDGWFRSGDFGYLDEDGFLFLTGRLNESINRGGVKIAPEEVDQVLTQHPAVAAAAVFAVPDARLGEEIVAAVVLASSETVSPRELRRWLLDRLAPAKVPRRIWFVAELPRTPTGKVRRGELARQWAEARE
jgi:acyl-CoA synthetase (AMP-forming)/AMP-acid ligase II